MNASDLVIAAVVLAGALALLYRSVWKKGGGCHGCDGAACGRPAPAPLVRLGAGGGQRRRTGGAGASSS